MAISNHAAPLYNVLRSPLILCWDTMLSFTRFQSPFQLHASFRIETGKFNM